MIDKPVLYCMWRHLNPDGRMVDYLRWLAAAYARHENAWERWYARRRIAGEVTPQQLTGKDIAFASFESDMAEAFINSGGTRLPC